MVTIHVGRKTISNLNFKLMILVDPRHCFVHAFDHKDFTDFVLMKGESLTAKYIPSAFILFYGIINFYATFSDEDAIMFKLTFGLDHFS